MTAVLVPRALAALLLLLALPAAARAQDCPATGPVDERVPTWSQVNGFELGTRQATYAEVVRFMRAVDRASDRVELGVLARSWAGRDLPYAVVTEPGRDVDAVAAAMRALREGRMKAPDMQRVAREVPAIAWITAGVHGNEPSATDAHMRVLYELAARGDCENRRRLAELVTVLLPMQNPDGREDTARTNRYAFDLNRDWFARTQPETEGKLRALRRMPPIVYVDGHEQAGTAGFFPPNADPIHHEIPAQALRHINDVYSPPMRAAMDARGADYTNYTVYDMFFMGYGDTVPATLFGGAGMTFEKGGQAPYPEKEADHFTLADTVLDVAAARKGELLGEWAQGWHDARSQGSSGVLQPNLTVQPENSVVFPVPDVRVWAYVLRASRHAADAAALADRLRSMGVEVHRLRRPLRVGDYAPYGEAPRAARLPRGTYVVRMGQPLKHWVQALLGEDSYVPFPYFYDVSGWSNPLLMGLDAGRIVSAPPRRSLRPRRRRPLLAPLRDAADAAIPRGSAYALRGDSAGALRLAFALLAEGVELRRAPAAFSAGVRGRRRPATLPAGTLVVPGSVERSLLRRLAARHRTPVHALTERPAGTLALRAPRVAVLSDPVLAAGHAPGLGIAKALGQSTGWTLFVLERRLAQPAALLTTAEIAAGRLDSDAFSHLVVPDGLVPEGGLDPAALRRIQEFVRGGGVYVGLREQGLGVAQAAGLTTAERRQAPEGFQVPGAVFRVAVDPADPLAWGLSGESWVFNTGDPIIEPGTSSGREVLRYPGPDRFFASGYTEGAEALQGTVAALDEPLGDGRSLLLAPDANFRAYVESTERLFANALLYPAGVGPAPAARSRPVRPELLRDGTSPVRDTVVRVPPSGAAALRASAAGVPGARFSASAAGIELRVPKHDSGHPPLWLRGLLERLERAGTRPTLLIY